MQTVYVNIEFMTTHGVYAFYQMSVSNFILIAVLTLRLAASLAAEDISDVDYEDEETLDDASSGNEEPPVERKSRFIDSFENQFVGTNLLGPRGLHRKCFTPEDEELLSARMAFEVKLFARYWFGHYFNMDFGKLVYRF